MFMNINELKNFFFFFTDSVVGNYDETFHFNPPERKDLEIARNKRFVFSFVWKNLLYFELSFIFPP
jgi:hypothetical protein